MQIRAAVCHGRFIVVIKLIAFIIGIFIKEIFMKYKNYLIFLNFFLTLTDSGFILVCKKEGRKSGCLHLKRRRESDEEGEGDLVFITSGLSPLNSHTCLLVKTY